LAVAFYAVAGSTAQILFVPPADARRTVEEIMPKLPQQLGGGASRVLTRGIVWCAIGLNLSPARLAASVVLQSVNADAAVALDAELANILRAAGDSRETLGLAPRFAEFARALRPTVSGDQLTLMLDEPGGGLLAVASLVAPQVKAARIAASQARSMNNLKQIMLAMFNYSDTHKKFPPRASYSADGKPLLSWRVQLLPYLDAGDLYNEFKLDEPWDSEHNRKLIERLPDVLRSPLANAGTGRTTYVVPVLAGGIFGGKEALDFKEIIDGLSNTIAVVEADDDHAVVWTKPEDIEPDVSDPARGLRRATIGGFLIGIADGAVRSLPGDMSPEALRPLFTANGKEPARWP
jgi:hypothetical protein